MYTAHFGLREKPFSLIPDAESIYFSSGHRAAFTMLEYGLLESVGITLITGDVGTGKTTLIRHLLRRIDYQHLNVALVSTSHSAYGSLLRWLVNAFNVDESSSDEGLLLRALQEYLIEHYANGKRSVVILDEAQNISMDELESLRLLTNLNADKAQLLQIILVGQPELQHSFYEPGMSQLAQRVSAEHHLEPFTLNETMSYINHRVVAAGGIRKLFDTNSLMAVYYYSGGVPRIINTLCDGALVFAYGLGADQVTLDVMLAVVRTKQIGGIHRPGIESDPGRITVRADMKLMKRVDLMDFVG